ncbi:heptose-I-phosphate ethanolaminephosphotransferase [Succiniclasticum ruminis]|uniref:Heptose-I-phosphate ethanolaminephosphotransferase n=1 Tax=Succiniclasticum ruminis TaxID=40841 RepID=A0A1G6I1U7_9FIRM|nr:phosphoethanolamine transferase [Succiniclasticum ruminis]SDC00388.1 heptose-I-phosphate ethanolaminephosphotransferase [Succiniclasticum ruminis]
MNKRRLIQNFVVFLVSYVVFIFFLSLLATYRQYFFENYVSILFTATCVDLVLLLWNYNRKIIIIFFIFSILYTSAGLINLFIDIFLSGKEIISSLILGNLICCLISLLLRFAQNLKDNIQRKISYLFLNVIVIVALLIPFLFIGYYFLSDQILSTTIVLTLFQTNLPEIYGYLKDKNIFLWCSVFVITFFAIGGITFFINKIADNTLVSLNIATSIGVFVELIFFLYNTKPILTDCYILNVFRQTQIVLKEYRDYGKAKALRQHNLEVLKGLTIAAGKGGLYVLVIGESETRDHMHVYGYGEETTPWLSDMNKTKEQTRLIVFDNAYSNHTHTVPVLTYALSVKNQYNNIDIKNAYSLIEVAKVAGFTTYWISNQLKYGGWDTPVAEMASAADHEIWINGSVGLVLGSDFYDEKIVEELEKLSLRDNNILVVCHLMGNHGFYRYRYPSEFQRYDISQRRSDLSENVWAYDNSVYYTDYILRRIYEVVSQKPNFKSMVYLSDHGEDPDNGVSHEASKFTWKMARIPLVMFFSDSFIKESGDTVTTLAKHKKNYWTNDLLYNLMINIMHIENAPYNDNKWNLSSENYEMKKEVLKTLHGSKSLSEER